MWFCVRYVEQNPVRVGIAKELERRGYRFARYADDTIIVLGSTKTFSEGQRIKQEVETFLKTPKLPINEGKSQVVRKRPAKYT